MLKSKIHRARVTRGNIAYEGSITIDKKLMEAADIVPYEQVHILNINNGARFHTYAIEGEANSGEICLNGAAARLVAPKDLVIIASFVDMTNLEALNHEPKLVFVDDNNRMLPTRQEEAGQAKLKKVVW